MERTAVDEHQPIQIPELASKMVDIYWQQTLPYPGRGDVLRQSSTPGQAKIVSLIRDFRVPLEQWLERFRPGAPIAEGIADVGARLRWERQPRRTYGAAKTAYLYATPATLFWAHGTGLHRSLV